MSLRTLQTTHPYTSIDKVYADESSVTTQTLGRKVKTMPSIEETLALIEIRDRLEAIDDQLLLAKENIQYLGEKVALHSLELDLTAIEFGLSDLDAEE